MSPTLRPFEPAPGIVNAMIAMKKNQIILHAPSVGEQQNFRNGTQQIFRNHQLVIVNVSVARATHSGGAPATSY
jgi:hypothetical protein